MTHDFEQLTTFDDSQSFSTNKTTLIQPMTHDKSNLYLFVDTIKTNEGALRSFRKMAVHFGYYEAAEKARQLESELYPRTDEHEKAEGIAKEMTNVLSIMGTQVTRQTAYRIYLAALAVKKKGGKVKIDEISDIIHASETLIR